MNKDLEKVKENNANDRRLSITVDDTEFYIDPEMLSGLFSFKDLLQRKLIPANFKSTANASSKASSANQSQSQEHTDKDEYNLQVARARCPPEWGRNLQRIAFTEQQIQDKVCEIADKISRDYNGKEIVAVGLLTGAVCFMTDLLKHVRVPYIIDFISCSSYGKGTVSKGSPVMNKDMSMDPAGKHILLIEDIIDTGRTLAWLKTYLAGKNCASVKIACLLDKKARRTEKDVHVDYMGLECPNDFVVGYGMDFAGHYRCLPFIGILKPEAYS